ncbi:carbohydrate kinase family protein [Streptomyces silvisoli]|uniref:PfkB family carbohydrate kinase n=1 Tax=Streptomyces silvisoli TaxID=3034235 RepID=A0ABT5ZPA6_9ACTN|nr:PfkB family carbohydrate kinase [Streptomyces silvisoli]MDF3291661.1 PfkB family carbohydrate kinase [Streptomyces silvisoli]
MVTTHPAIVVIGSLAVDRKSFASGTYRCGSGSGGSGTVWGRERHHGGVGRNAAVNLARLGCRVSFCGLTGPGADAAALEAELTELGVLLLLRRIANGVGRFEVFLGPGGALLSSGIRLPDPAETRHLCDPALAERIAGADAVVVEGGLDPRLLRWVSGQARRHGTTVCCLPTRLRDLGARRELLPAFDVLVLNEAEATAILGAPRPDATELAAALTDLGPGTVVVTRGARGAVLAGPEVVRLPAQPGPCVDDTGAGDALASAFIAAAVRGQNPVDALREGLRAARVTINCRNTTCRSLSPAAVR